MKLLYSFVAAFALTWLPIEPECRCTEGGKCTCVDCQCAEQTCFKNKPVRAWFRKHFGRR